MKEMISILSTEEWRDQAACLAYPADTFFGLDDSEAAADRRVREEEAKLICSRCVVRAECLEYALRSREAYGVWGGLTESERRARLHRAVH